jgi:hypothetical protein
MDDKYRPRMMEELMEDPIPVSLINEPLPPENVVALPPKRPIRSTLCCAIFD